MRVCVKDLIGSGSGHDPVTVSYAVIGGWSFDSKLYSRFHCDVQTLVFQTSFTSYDSPVLTLSQEGSISSVNSFHRQISRIILIVSMGESGQMNRSGRVMVRLS